MLERFAMALAPAEREAVLGDLAESERTFLSGLADIAGLALRRGTAACRQPQTIVAFFFLVLPLTLLLTALTQRTASGSAISLWFWIDNADLHLLQNAGFWRCVADGAPRLLYAWGMLALYGWSAGMLTRCVSSATARLFYFMIALMAIVWPLFADPNHGSQNDAVFHLVFYRVVLPCLVQCVFVLLPALFATRQPRLENLR